MGLRLIVFHVFKGDRRTAGVGAARARARRSPPKRRERSYPLITTEDFAKFLLNAPDGPIVDYFKRRLCGAAA
jgi:hypothetical protein